MQQAAASITDSLRSTDTAAVLDLAAQIGVRQPVRLELLPHLVGCPVVRAVSPVTVKGDRRSWFELAVRRRGRDTGGYPCQVDNTERAKVRTSGPWVASSAELSERAEWRIHDGDWYVDIALGTGMVYDDARLIVRAVRQGQLVNQMPQALKRFYGDTLPVIEASDIQDISMGRDQANTFEVSTGRGRVLYVSILAGQVLVQNIGTWRS